MVGGIANSAPFAGQVFTQPQPAKGGGFLDSLKSAIGEVEDQHQAAQSSVASVLEGKGEDVHSAAIAVEKASLSFELMMQLRNKAVAAYQEVARMQF